MIDEREGGKMKRYTALAALEAGEGDWVRYEDAAAEIERLRAERDQALADIDHIWDVPMGRYGDVGMDDSSPGEAMNSILDHAENLQFGTIERLREALWQIWTLASRPCVVEIAREALGLDDGGEK